MERFCFSDDLNKQDEKNSVKIATYNILKGGSQRVHWIKMIEDFGVDLLLLQESYSHDQHLPPLLYPDLQNQSAWAMIDKRGVEPLRFSPGMTQQAKERAFERAGRECSAEYLQHVTKQERVDDVVATMAALAAQPWVRETILVGHSEGTHVTTGVLKQTSSITAAGLFASVDGQKRQLFDTSKPAIN